MNNSIKTETATVYRGGGKRYFTKRAAAKAEARKMMFRKYPCDCSEPEPEVGDSGVSCYLHCMDSNQYQKFILRVARAVLRGAK